MDDDYLVLRQLHLDQRYKHPERRRAAEAAALTFILPRTGKARCVSGNSEHSLTAGDVLVIRSSAEFWLEGDPKTVVWVFSVLLPQLFPIISGDQLRQARVFTESVERPKVYPASGPCAAKCHRLVAEVPAMEVPFDHRVSLLRIAGVVVDAEAARTPPVASVRNEQDALQTLQRMSLAELATLSVDDLALRFHCSRRQLSRFFRKHFGVTVAAMRMEMRLLHASSLLRDPEVKVIHVAEECGFNHLGLFNVCFKRRFGETPGQFRKILVPAARPDAGAASCVCWLRRLGLCPGWSSAEKSPPLKALPASEARRRNSARP